MKFQEHTLRTRLLPPMTTADLQATLEQARSNFKRFRLLESIHDYKLYILYAFPQWASQEAMIIGPTAQLRKDPTDNASVITVLKVGELVKLLEIKATSTENVWYRVASTTRTGWIPGHALELQTKLDNIRPTLVVHKSDLQKLPELDQVFYQLGAARSRLAENVFTKESKEEYERYFRAQFGFYTSPPNQFLYCGEEFSIIANTFPESPYAAQCEYQLLKKKSSWGEWSKDRAFQDVDMWTKFLSKYERVDPETLYRVIERCAADYNYPATVSGNVKLYETIIEPEPKEPAERKKQREKLLTFYNKYLKKYKYLDQNYEPIRFFILAELKRQELIEKSYR